MRVFSRRFLIGASLLILLCSSCNLPSITPLPTGQVSYPNPAENGTSTALIPVTGMEAVTLQCQFCVNDEPHAVLILPEAATFLVSNPVIGVDCNTAQVTLGRRILFCRGAQHTPFTLNVCLNNSNCFQYPVSLGSCPINSATGVATPLVLNPGQAGISPTSPVINSPASPPTQTLASASPVVTPTVIPSLSTQTGPTVTATAVPSLTTQSLPTVPATAILLQPTGTSVPGPGLGTHFPQPNGAPASTTRIPRTSLNDPVGFVRWYFEAVWQERNYQDLWDNYLTPNFKARPNAGDLQAYATWWNSVDRVDVNSVNVIQNDGMHAWVRVNATLNMKDGRVLKNQIYDYTLFFDATRQTWMFDYLP